MTISQKPARRHHFIPQFYLREWHDGNAGVWLYGKKSNGEIFLKRRPAKSIGHAENLYSIKPEGVFPFQETDADIFERNFFAPLDQAASHIYRKLITTGVNSLSPEDRYTWALFINSLIERTPKRIEELESHVNTFEILKRFRKQWPTSSLPDKIDLEAVKRNAILKALASFILDEAFAKHVANMVWLTIDLPEGQDHFLTSDSPLILNDGKNIPPVHVLTIALSPHRLLIMHTVDDQFDQEFVNTLSLTYNPQIAIQAEKHLISSRRLADSACIKYTRIANELLGRQNL